MSSRHIDKMRVLTILSFTLAYLSVGLGECPNGCDKHTLLYESMGCTPKYQNPDDCCPKEYDCAVIINTPPRQCHFQGHYYKEHDTVPNELTEPGCEILCNCEELYMSNGSFHYHCGALDCPENMGGLYKEGCILQYRLGECCSTGMVCPPFDTLEKCEVDGKTYYEGQQFWPKPCTSCICKKGFNGELKEPFCKKFTCVSELSNMYQIDKYYAPYYYSHDACCPTEWLEPLDSDPKIKSQNSSGSRCRFGSNYYDIGASFNRTIERNYFLKQEYHCQCEIPPFLTCTGREIFDPEKTPEHFRHHLTTEATN